MQGEPEADPSGASRLLGRARYQRALLTANSYALLRNEGISVVSLYRTDMGPNPQNWVQRLGVIEIPLDGCSTGISTWSSARSIVRL